MRVQNATLLCRNLSARGIDCRLIGDKTSYACRVHIGEVRRSLRDRPDVSRTLWLSRREDLARKAAEDWRHEYQWRMKSAFWRVIGPGLVAGGVAMMGYFLKSGWLKPASIETSETYGGQTP